MYHSSVQNATAHAHTAADGSAPAQGIGQGGDNTANQTRIFLADTDFDPPEPLARHAGAVT